MRRTLDKPLSRHLCPFAKHTHISLHLIVYLQFPYNEDLWVRLAVCHSMWRVSDHNGVSRLYSMLEIYHSDTEP